MQHASYFTIGEIADFYAEPQWKVRRIVDSLPDEIPRAGRYRLVPRALLPKIGALLQGTESKEDVIA